ncbi:YfcE family phosphodiesterase [candidate division KSB3 bacterium]|uniref:Phosphoesterase n=1 Tax=candidate division KSB3 bacterium TaxID=2044937 RepID=A0A9D5Q7X4_9BACT|nr:YfcE family phosphodiesterase [candidate division KSB3 bacterium]MBD3327360.1 YfcE family phosphodiesterase [candidate division KSB3 bacterium]
MTLGIIADTHGQLDTQVHTLFDHVDEIIHAGDIGGDEIIIELQTIAPVTAVRGNMDRVGKTATYHEFLTRTFGGIRFFIVHDLGFPQTIKAHLQRVIRSYAPHVVIFGHTHIPSMTSLQETLYFNPGSAHHGRRGHPRSLGLIDITDSHVEGRLLSLASP